MEVPETAPYSNLYKARLVCGVLYMSLVKPLIPRNTSVIGISHSEDLRTQYPDVLMNRLLHYNTLHSV